MRGVAAVQSVSSALGRLGPRGRLAGALALACLALAAWPAARPLFWPGFPATFDGITHLRRTVELSQLLRAGVVFPRWFPDFAQGHGYPLFVYYPPLSYYPPALLTLAGMPAPLALELAAAAGVVVSLWGMHLLARGLGANRLAAFAAAIAYGYFSFHLQELYTKGDYPEAWGLALMPWLTLALVRAAAAPRRGRVVIAGFATAALIACHNLVALVGLPLATIWALLLRRDKLAPTVRSLALAEALGLAASAAYWFPAVTEIHLAHISEFRNETTADHFYPLSGLVRWPLAASYGSPDLKLSGADAIALAVAAVAVVLTLLLRRRASWLAVFGGGSAAALCLSLTRPAAGAWQTLPLVAYVQYPSRMLLFVGLDVALLLALVCAMVRWLTVPAIAAAALLAWSSVQAIPTDRLAIDAAEPSVHLLYSFDASVAARGGIDDRQFVPADVSTTVLNSAATPDPATVAVSALTGQPLDLRMTVRSDGPAMLHNQQFFFPGWAAQIDGRAAPLAPAAGSGLIELKLPGGEHQVRLWYAGTLAEQASLLVSGLAIVVGCTVLCRRVWGAGITAIGLAIAWAGLATLPHVADPTVGPVVSGSTIQVARWEVSGPRDSQQEFVLADGSGRTVLSWPERQARVLPFAYEVDNEIVRQPYLLELTPDVPPGAYQLRLGGSALGRVRVGSTAASYTPLGAQFQHGIALDGYRASRLPPGASGPVDAIGYPGDFVELALRWTAQQPVAASYTAFVHLLDAQGQEVAGQDHDPNARLQGTATWVRGQAVTDRYILKLPDRLPPGAYRFEAGLYQAGDHLEPVPTLQGGNAVLFGSVKVRPRQLAPAPAGAPVWQRSIALAGWRQSGNSPLRLTFDWYATAQPDAAYTLFVHLSDGSGKVVAQADSPPQSGAFPTSWWQAGDAVSDVHAVAGAAPGRYRLSIGWYSPNTGRRLLLSDGHDELDLGEIMVGT